MRKQMNTTVLGEFELFDPSKQLTWSEREALEQKGLVIQGADLRPLRDKTLAFKNSRVWLKHDQVFHLGYCPQIQQLRLKQASIDRKSTRLNSSHVRTSYAVFCLKKKTS